MIIWRICKARFRALNGEGARLYGGRWNSPGRAVVYCADSPALAALEVRVHLDVMPRDFCLYGIDCGDIACESPGNLQDQVQRGDAWLAEGRTALLSVPSVIVPECRNILINPAHPDAAAIRIASSRAFPFDPRLFKP